MDLTSDSGAAFRASGLGWAYDLNLAEEYGWRPAGTERPPRLPPTVAWDGRYDSNEGQRVSRADAESLADALERALRDPEGAARAAAVTRRLSEEIRAVTGRDFTLEVPGTDADHQRSLIGFLRSGSFEIS
jgi:hypothetical protein